MLRGLRALSEGTAVGYCFITCLSSFIVLCSSASFQEENRESLSASDVAHLNFFALGLILVLSVRVLQDCSG